jgi:hypothetical protein
MANELLIIFTRKEALFLILGLIILIFLAGKIKESVQEAMIDAIRKKWNEKRKEHFKEASHLYPFLESLGYGNEGAAMDKQREYSEKSNEETAEEIKKEYNLTEEWWDGLEDIFLMEAIGAPNHKKKIKKIKKILRDKPVFYRKEQD